MNTSEKGKISKSLEYLSSSDFIKKYSSDLKDVLGIDVHFLPELKEVDGEPVLFLNSSPLEINNKFEAALFKKINVIAFSDFDIKYGNDNSLEDYMITLKFYVNLLGWSDKESSIPLGYGLYKQSTRDYTFTQIKDVDPSMIRRII